MTDGPAAAGAVTAPAVAPDPAVSPGPVPGRPVGWWLKEADARLEHAFDLRLRAEGVTTRRGWQVLGSAARAPVRRNDLSRT